MLKVSRRNGFSDRNGIKPENTIIQLKDFDETTRIRIVNFIKELYYWFYKEDVYKRSTHPELTEPIQNFIKYIYKEVYTIIIDKTKTYKLKYFWEDIENTILRSDYDDVLTLIEAIGQYWGNNSWRKEHIYFGFNQLFEKEYIGYRFIDGFIVPITDKIEIETINTALDNKFSEISEHISKATKLLSDREKPDYENSIKESITAVETICKIITNLNKSEATLGNMLKQLEKNNIYIHHALKTAFNNLYGFTSNETGIRHAGELGNCHSTFGEAKFMLVACSAFINYLLDLMSKLPKNK